MYDDDGKLVKSGVPQFDKNNPKFVRRMKIEMNDDHLHRSYEATKKQSPGRMGTMDIEDVIKSANEYVYLSTLCLHFVYTLTTY